MKKKRISVVGAGSWGTSLSLLLAKNGYEVDLWVYEKDLCNQLSNNREITILVKFNEKLFPCKYVFIFSDNTSNKLAL